MPGHEISCNNRLTKIALLMIEFYDGYQQKINNSASLQQGVATYFKPAQNDFSKFNPATKRPHTDPLKCYRSCLRHRL